MKNRIAAMLSFFFALGTAQAFAAGLAGSATPPSCPGDQPVWVNTKSKAYHLASDPLYGKTKHGTYACKAAADAAGDHLAKGRGGAMGASSSGSLASPAPGATPAPGASPSGKHHHNHHGAGAASPAPSPAAT